MPIDYQAHEWKAGEEGGTPVSAESLNRMEQGIADACAFADEYESSVPNGSVGVGSLDDTLSKTLLSGEEFSLELEVATGVSGYPVRLVCIGGVGMLRGRVSTNGKRDSIADLSSFVGEGYINGYAGYFPCVGKMKSEDLEGVYPVYLDTDGILYADRAYEWLDLTGIVIKVN